MRPTVDRTEAGGTHNLLPQLPILESLHQHLAPMLDSGSSGFMNQTLTPEGSECLVAMPFSGLSVLQGLASQAIVVLMLPPKLGRKEQETPQHLGAKYTLSCPLFGATTFLLPPNDKIPLTLLGQ